MSAMTPERLAQMHAQVSDLMRSRDNQTRRAGESLDQALAHIERLEGDLKKRTAVTTAQTVALTKLGDDYSAEFNRAEGLNVERYELRTHLAARDAEVEALKHRLCELEVGDACFTPTHADVYLSVCKERDALKAEIEGLKANTGGGVAVCYKHAREAEYQAGKPCLVCRAEKAEAEGTPLQLFDPEEFERRVAFIEGRKR